MKDHVLKSLLFGFVQSVSLMTFHFFRFPTASSTVFRSLLISLYSILFSAAYTCASTIADSTLFSISDSASTDFNLYMETIKVLSALAITIVLLVLALYFFRKILRVKGMAGAGAGAVQVLEIHHIDPKKKIVLVKVLDRVLIVGCADNAIANLGELSSDEIGRLNVEKRIDPGVFKAVLNRFTGTSKKQSADSGEV